VVNAVVPDAKTKTKMPRKPTKRAKVRNTVKKGAKHAKSVEENKFRSLQKN
jgi:hypothetical protein